MNKIIIDNYNYEKGTFTYKYKYEDIIDITLLLELVDRIAQDFIELNDKPNLNFLTIIFEIFSSLNVALIAHYSPYDMLELKNVEKRILAPVLRFRQVMILILNEDRKGLFDYEDDIGEGKLNITTKK